MRLTIQYCTAWGYLDRAVGLAQNLLKEHATRFDEVALLPGSGGVFEVVLDGEPIFSKRETGRFPEYDEINEPLKARSAARA